MIKAQFTIGQWMSAIAAIAVGITFLPLWLVSLAVCLTILVLLLWTKVQKSGLATVAIFSLISIGLGATLSPPRTMHCGPTCAGNIRQISLALSQYLNRHGSCPPPYVADASGKPLYSWRVLVLPYLDSNDLYNGFNFSQSWDSPSNLSISKTNLRIFRCPQSGSIGSETDYLAVAGPGTAFPTQGRVATTHFRDGPSTTVILAEATGNHFHWAEPSDLDIRSMSMFINHTGWSSISGPHSAGPHVAFADGSVRALRSSFPPQVLKALLTINGGEKVDLREFEN